MGDSAAVSAGVVATPLESRIKAQAFALGFDLCGIAVLAPAATAPALNRWLAEGRAGEMSYMERHVEERHDPRRVNPGSRSAVVVAMNYGGAEAPGPVARYARGADYHDVMKEMLGVLAAWLCEATGREVSSRAYVDTAPILERDLARQAGLGWFGKNTNLINPQLGSFFFIGSLFTELALVPDEPFDTEHCGSCTRCLEACPTEAITAPGELDARRCISYLTIEHRGAIDEALRPSIGELLYGCDICQDVCPWNVKFSRELPAGSPLAPRAALGGRDARALAREILTMDADGYAEAFRGSAMKRAKLRGLKRNAAVVLGNVGGADDVDILLATASGDEPMVAGHAAWAVERISRRAD
jgi:epoxyqueuosine reductase